MMNRQTLKCVFRSRAGSASASPLESLLPASDSGPSRVPDNRDEGPSMPHGASPQSTLRLTEQQYKRLSASVYETSIIVAITLGLTTG